MAGAVDDCRNTAFEEPLLQAGGRPEQDPEIDLGFIRERLEAKGIHLVDLQPHWRTEVDRIVYEELAAGRVVRESQRKLKTLITELSKQKVQAVVLGCTELALAVDTRANVIPVYDTTAIHARAAVEWMLAEEVSEQARAAA